MNKSSRHPLRRWLAISLWVGSSSMLHAADTSKLAVESPAVVTARQEAELKLAEQELATLRREVRGAEREARQAGGSSDAATATRVLATEKLLTKERQTSALRRARYQQAGQAERRQLQQALSTATSSEERAAILDRHSALQRALIMETSAQTSAAASKTSDQASP